jgi:hypothetical protein
MNALARHNWSDTQHRDQFSMAIEAGQEEMWLALRDMPKSGFTPIMLAAASGSTAGSAHSYLTLLVRKGLALNMGETTDKQKLFQVSRVGIEPEVLNDNGDPDEDYIVRRVLWRAVRSHKTVSVTSLWTFAIEHLEITKQKVRKFINRLVAANYLVELDRQKGEAEPHFHLRPAMDSGKLPPRFCQADLVYDINKRAFFGKAMAKAVAL